ncbi:MAG TPA: acyl-CoA dehydrogenase family protein [Acidimicrobiales bacterium]|nr:acyl-CoA dehydrogenase family protein [Acidimicrobiales bacterium]
MASYFDENVEHLPFSTPDKARRYDTDRYEGAVGLNWYSSDPTLQFLMRAHLGDEGLAWATPHLQRVGALMGGPIARRAEETDRNPPRLEKYDRWGHDISRVVTPPSFEASKADLLADNFAGPSFAAEAARAGVDPAPMAAAWSYLLDQAEIGMTCALGTGGDMVARMAERFAPEDVKPIVRELLADGDFGGEAAQLFTERAGGADLAMLETTATPDGDSWRLNGLKWFASNANGSAYVVLAKPEGAPDATRGVAPFLVLRTRRDGSRNGVRIRQLKDKLGTRAVASAEIELVDAEGFLLAPAPRGTGGAGGTDASTALATDAAADGRGLARMMELTNGARLGIAMMGLGCARRALVESLCYARRREAFGAALIDQPLMQRKLAEMIVETEATQALVFDGFLGPSWRGRAGGEWPRLRIGAPLVKLRAARHGIAAASDAVEIHGGNGYIETWPVARIFRDAQVNTVWEGPDNILCLDVRRGIDKEDAHLALFDRITGALEHAGRSDTATVGLVERRLGELRRSVEVWRSLERPVAEARLFPLAQYMVDVYTAALLVEQAGEEERTSSSSRKALVAKLFARSHLQEAGTLRGIEEPALELERFKELSDGALVDPRA